MLSSWREKKTAVAGLRSRKPGRAVEILIRRGRSSISLDRGRSPTLSPVAICTYEVGHFRQSCYCPQYLIRRKYQDCGGVVGDEPRYPFRGEINEIGRAIVSHRYGLDVRAVEKALVQRIAIADRR